MSLETISPRLATGKPHSNANKVNLKAGKTKVNDNERRAQNGPKTNAQHFTVHYNITGAERARLIL